MNINVSIRFEEFAIDVNFDTQLRALFQDLATTYQNDFTLIYDKNNTCNHISFKSTVKFCYTHLIERINLIIQVYNSEAQEILNNAVWFKYKIETSNAERDKTNYRNFISEIIRTKNIICTS